MDLYRFLSLCLWISPHALLTAVAFLMIRRRLYREFPVFLSYLLYETAEFVLLFIMVRIPSISGEQYAYAFLATLVFSIALRFGVIEEVIENLFREYQLLEVNPRRQLRWVKIALVLAAFAFAVYAPGENRTRLMGGLALVNRGVGFIQCGLLVFLLCFSRFLGLSWRSYSFGIAFGLGILSSVDLATSAVSAQFANESWIVFLSMVTMGAYLVCVLVWLGYLLAPDRKPALVTEVSRNELDDWNREVQQLLRS